MEKKFLVTDWHDDCDISVFNTLEEANKAARDLWLRLTIAERSKRQISVGCVTRDMLDEEAIDEDGNIDWTMSTDILGAEGTFDTDDIQAMIDAARAWEREQEQLDEDVDVIVEVSRIDFDLDRKAWFVPAIIDQEHDGDLYLEGGKAVLKK